MKITNYMIEQVYVNSKKVISGELDKKEAEKDLCETTGMNKSSAIGYIASCSMMIEGKEYNRTMNTFATKYYLENIKKDFGDDIFKQSVDATDKHTKYYKNLGKASLVSIEDIVKEMRELYLIKSEVG